MNLLRKLFGNKPSAPVPAASSTPATPGSTTAAAPQVGLQHLWSDTPNALKFQLDRVLVPGGETRRYESAEAAGQSPLAQALFAAGGIEAVEMERMQITITMAENADWAGLQNSVPTMIRKFFSAGGKPLTAQAGAGRYRFGFKQVQARPREEQIQVVQELFDKEVNPAVAAHGGYFNLLDIQDNNVYVELGGGCQGCGMANVTLRQGVESRLREVMPEMVELIDQTDHANGKNPYHQPSKK